MMAMQSSHHNLSATPANQHTAPVLEYRCLYTADLRKKQKKWQDGRLKFHTFNKKVMVFDDRSNFIGDTHWRESYDLEEGCELQLERGSFMVEVADFVVRRDQDLTDLIDKPLKDKVDRARARATISSPAQAQAQTYHATLTDAPSLAGHQGRPKPLTALLGTPSGHYGRASAPTTSPFEQRRRELLESSETPRPMKRQRRSSPPTSSGYAQNLTGATLTLAPRSSNTSSSRMLFSRPRTSVYPQAVANVDLTGEINGVNGGIVDGWTSTANLAPPNPTRAQVSRGHSQPSGYAQNLTGAALNLGAPSKSKIRAGNRLPRKIFYPSTTDEDFIDIDSTQAQRSPSPELMKSKSYRSETLPQAQRTQENIDPNQSTMLMLQDTNDLVKARQKSRSRRLNPPHTVKENISSATSTCKRTGKTCVPRTTGPVSHERVAARPEIPHIEEESSTMTDQAGQHPRRSTSPATPEHKERTATRDKIQINEEGIALEESTSQAVQRIKSFNFTSMPMSSDQETRLSRPLKAVVASQSPTLQSRGAETEPINVLVDADCNISITNARPSAESCDVHIQQPLKIKSRPKKPTLHSTAIMSDIANSEKQTQIAASADSMSTYSQTREVMPSLRIGRKSKKAKLYISRPESASHRNGQKEIELPKSPGLHEQFEQQQFPRPETIIQRFPPAIASSKQDISSTLAGHSTCSPHPVVSQKGMDSSAKGLAKSKTNPSVRKLQNEILANIQEKSEIQVTTDTSRDDHDTYPSQPSIKEGPSYQGSISFTCIGVSDQNDVSIEFKSHIPYTNPNIDSSPAVYAPAPFGKGKREVVVTTEETSKGLGSSSVDVSLSLGDSQPSTQPDALISSSAISVISINPGNDVRPTGDVCRQHQITRGAKLVSESNDDIYNIATALPLFRRPFLPVQPQRIAVDGTAIEHESAATSQVAHEVSGEARTSLVNSASKRGRATIENDNSPVLSTTMTVHTSVGLPPRFFTNMPLPTVPSRRQYPTRDTVETISAEPFDDEGPPPSRIPVPFTPTESGPWSREAGDLFDWRKPTK